MIPLPDDPAMAALMDHHLRNPAPSAEDLLLVKKVTLADEVNSKIRIYLDQNFWIDLSQAADRGGKPEFRDLLALLREKVAAGKIICPAGEVVLTELLKNGNAEARVQTADLVEELSCGVAIENFRDRTIREAAAAIEPGGDLVLAKSLAWTKLPFAFGHPVGPKPPTMPVPVHQAIQKSFTDHMWGQPFREIVMAMKGERSRTDTYTEMANDIIKFIELEGPTIRNFKEMAEATAHLTAERVSKEHLLEVMLDLAKRSKMPYPTLTPEQEEAVITMGRKAIANGIRLQTKKAIECMPSLVIWHLLVSTFLMEMKNSLKNKGGRMLIEDNDLYDFEHAIAAAGYCNHFFSERKLGSRLNRPEINVSALYPCRVSNNIQSALEVVRAI